MHAGQGGAIGDDFGLSFGQFIEALADLVAWLELFGESDIGGMVACFAFEQATVELGQFRFAVGHVFAEEAESFAAARFDQAGDEEAIDGAERFVGSHESVESSSVGSRLEASEGYAALIESFEHHLVVFEFFDHDAAHFVAEFSIFGIGIHQAHRDRSRFALAVGVIDEDLVEMLVDLLEPTLGRFGLQVQHGCSRG